MNHVHAVLAASARNATFNSALCRVSAVVLKVKLSRRINNIGIAAGIDDTKCAGLNGVAGWESRLPYANPKQLCDGIIQSRETKVACWGFSRPSW